MQTATATTSAGKASAVGRESWAKAKPSPRANADAGETQELVQEPGQEVARNVDAHLSMFHSVRDRDMLLEDAGARPPSSPAAAAEPR